MPPTVWCAHHAVRFPLNSASVEQLCPAGHSVRLEGVTAHCPVCDLYWDARQVEQPDVCPYCQTPNVTRRLCHTCEQITYLPPDVSGRPQCSRCGTVFDKDEALSHTCRFLRTTVVTQHRQCPVCQSPVEAPAAVSQSGAATQAIIVRPGLPPATTETEATSAAVALEEGITITAPVRARELHQRYLPKLIRVHFDYNLRRFLRNEKGLFYACGVGTPPNSYHIIPSWSRFGVAGDFVHWFSEIFECDRPRGGEIWVSAPAIADAEGVLQVKGRLEVNRPPDVPPPSDVLLPSEAVASPVRVAEAASKTIAIDAALPLDPVVHPAPATSEEGKQRGTQPRPLPARRARRRWLWPTVVVVGIAGLTVWKTYLVPPAAINQTKTAPQPSGSQPNQPQAANQTGQEAILTALDGLAQAFSAQQREHYRSYFNTTLRPYYNRREEMSERAVNDMAKLGEMYTELSMAHAMSQVQLDAGGESATVLTDRTLRGRHRQTGETLNDTRHLRYRFVKRGRYWLVAGVTEVKPTSETPLKSKARAK